MALIDHWPLTDGSGTTASNLVRSSNDGIIINSPTWITDSPNGGGLHFNGAEGYWHCPNSYTSEPRYTGMTYVTTQAVTPGSGSFVVTGWFRVPSGEASGGPMIGWNDKQSPTVTGQVPGEEYKLSVYQGAVTMYLEPAGNLNVYTYSSWLPDGGPPPYYAFQGLRSDGRFDDGSWHYVVLRYCQTLVWPNYVYSTAVFVDGAKVAEINPSRRILTSGGSYPYWHIGGVGWVERFGCDEQTVFLPGLEGIDAVPRSFHGDITDVRVYDACVSDEDILGWVRLIEAGTGVFTLNGSRTNILKPGAFDVTGNPIAVGLSMAARPGEYVVAGQPARLIADVVTPPEVEPNPIWFSCNT